MNNPLISVVVPVYNVEAFLDDCVESIISQTYANLEIILVDDGSTDSSAELCDKWMKSDSRVMVIHKTNGGLSSARNAGIEIARGEYIGFIDSDDYIHPQMYECLLKLLNKSSRKMASCSFERVQDSNGIQCRREMSLGKELDVRKTLDGVFCGSINVSVCCKLFTKDVFDSVRFPVGETNEDVCVTIPTIAISGGSISTGEKLYYYRDRATSITHSYWKTDADVVYCHLQQMKEQLKSIGFDNIPSFNIYLGKSAYSTALYLDKNYGRISSNAKENQRKYIAIMRKYWLQILVSKHMKLKDKVLYLMIATRTLRPIYTLMGKELH